MAQVVVTELKVDARGAVQGVQQYESAMDKAAAAVDKATRPQKQLSDLINKQIAQMDKLRAQIDPAADAYAKLAAANDNAAKSFQVTGTELLSVAKHLKTATAAAYALSPAFRAMVNPAIAAGVKAIGPAAASAGATVIGALSPALAVVSRIAIPVWLAVEAFRAMNAITELGAKKIEEFNKIASNAGGAGVGTDTFQRHVAGAKELGIATDIAAESLKRFNEASQPKLGGSAFDKRLDQLSNFANNAGVAAVKQATDVESRYRAAVGLITSAIGQGERLAALDLAATFLPPELLERLRANGEALKDMQATADKIKPADIVGVDQIGQAIDLKKRLEDAHEVIEKRFAPIKRDLTQLGLNYQSSWVATVELMATAVTHAAALYGWLKGIPEIMAQAGNAGWIKSLGDWMEKQGWNSTPKSAGLTVGGDTDKEAATKRLAGLLKNQAEIQRAMRESTDVAVAVFGDKSVATLEKVTKATTQGASSYDMLTQRTQDRIKELELEAQGYGRGSAAVIQMKIAHDLERAAKRDGMAVDEAKRKEIDQLAASYAAAATAAKLASIQRDIRFDRQTMFLSDTDVQIAQRLRDVYADIPTALASSEASAMRFNAMLREINNTAGDMASAFVKDLAKGVDVMEALVSVAGQLAFAMMVDDGEADSAENPHRPNRTARVGSEPVTVRKDSEPDTGDNASMPTAKVA
jgi:hypothetical protein